jgi:hypothetical protein
VLVLVPKDGVRTGRLENYGCIKKSHIYIRNRALVQAFSQFRCKLQKKTEEEIETLRKNPKAVFRIHRIHMFLGLLDPDPDPLVRGMDPDPDLDPSIILQK